MELRTEEHIVKIIKRHKTPYLFKLIKILLVAIPAYIILIMVAKETGTELFIVFLAVVSFFVGIIITLISLDYLLDKLVITNKRIIWINWKSLFKRTEHEVEILDIQDIETRETGILSKFRFFDYGLIEVETAASKVCIAFTECPNPEGVKNFILGRIEKQRGGVKEKRENITGDSDEWSVN